MEEHMARVLNGRVQKFSLYATEEGISSNTCETAEDNADVVVETGEVTTIGATAKGKGDAIVTVVTTDDCKKRKKEGKAIQIHKLRIKHTVILV